MIYGSITVMSLIRWTILQCPYPVEDQVQQAMQSTDPYASFCKVSSMTLHWQSSALDWGELKGKKKWRKPLSLMEEPTAPTNQMAFVLTGNPLKPCTKETQENISNKKEWVCQRNEQKN